MIRKDKIIICVIIFIILFINIIQIVFKPFHIYPLNGSIKTTDTALFTWKNWLESEFQSTKENEIKINHGLSNVFIKLKNQTEFSLFKKLNANGVILGKENCLYELNYIKAYTGEDFIGEDSINKIITRVKLIQDTLEKYNKKILLVFCPGKASYFPEYIPGEFLKNRKKQTNINTFIKYSKKHQVRYLNLFDYFNAAKDTSKIPLFVKTGIHWTEYGDALVLLKLNAFFKDEFGFNQPKIEISEIEISKNPHGRDYDIAGGLNLLFSFDTPLLYYPKLKISQKPRNMPNGIVIADSYYWGIFGKSQSSYIFDNNDFWYYNKEVYNNKILGTKNPEELDINEEINKNNVFVIMATEATIHTFGWGVINRLYDAITKKQSQFSNINRYEERVNYWVNYILKDKKWLSDLRLRAEKSGISLDSAIKQDAIYQTEIGR